MVNHEIGRLWLESQWWAPISCPHTRMRAHTYTHLRAWGFRVPAGVWCGGCPHLYASAVHRGRLSSWKLVRQLKNDCQIVTLERVTWCTISLGTVQHMQLQFEQEVEHGLRSLTDISRFDCHSNVVLVAIVGGKGGSILSKTHPSPALSLDTRTLHPTLKQWAQRDSLTRFVIEIYSLPFKTSRSFWFDLVKSAFPVWLQNKCLQPNFQWKHAIFTFIHGQSCVDF